MKRKRRRVVFVAGAHAERVGLFVEGDGVLLAVGEAADDDARQAILALQPDEEVLEGDDVEDQPPGPVRLDLAPVLAARVVGRRLDDAEILGAAGIGQDDQPAFMMVDRIFVLGLARRYETRRRVRIGRIDQADLGGLVVVHAEQEIACRPASCRDRENSPGRSCSWIKPSRRFRADCCARTACAGRCSSSSQT